MATLMGTIFFKDMLGVRMKGNINLENSGIFPSLLKSPDGFLIICLILDQINSVIFPASLNTEIMAFASGFSLSAKTNALHSN